MMYWTRKLNGGFASIISDVQAAITGDTVATQTNGTAGAYTPKKGDILSLNDQGRACLAKYANISGTNYIEATNVLGLCEGPNFQGLAQGGVYAATTASNNSQSNTIAKVHTGTDDVYALPLKSGATVPVVGGKYAIALVANNEDAQLDTSNPAGSTAIAEVVSYDASANLCEIVFTAVQE